MLRVFQYHCNNTAAQTECFINSTAVFFPGFPSAAVALLSIEYVKDLRKDAGAVFTSTYKYKMWNKMKQRTDTDGGQVADFKKTMLAFQFGARNSSHVAVACCPLY